MAVLPACLPPGCLSVSRCVLAQLTDTNTNTDSQFHTVKLYPASDGLYNVALVHSSFVCQRQIVRPQAQDIISNLFTDFVELVGDGKVTTHAVLRLRSALFARWLCLVMSKHVYIIFLEYSTDFTNTPLCVPLLTGGERRLYPRRPGLLRRAAAVRGDRHLQGTHAHRHAGETRQHTAGQSAQCPEDS